MENSNENKLKLDPKHEKWFIIGMALCFMMFGLLFFGLNVKEHINYNKLLEGGYSTIGTVTNVKYSNSESETIRYTAEGTYTVDQQDYYFYFKTDRRVDYGYLVKIMYEEGNPANYAMEKSFTATYVFSSIFILMGGLVLFLIYRGFIRRNSLTDAEIYRMQIEREKRAKMIAEMDADDIWNCDITRPERNKRPDEKPYKKENPYMDERIYKGKTIQTKSNSAKIRLGTTAFYNKDKEE